MKTDQGPKASDVEVGAQAVGVVISSWVSRIRLRR